MQPEARLAALIFDVDGTLAETEEAHRRAFNETFAEFGLGWSWSVEDYRILLRTTGGKERMKAHAAAIGATVTDELVAKIHAQKTRRYGDIIAGRKVALRPGIADLVGQARNAGMRLAIATTTNRPNVDALVEATFGRPAGEVFEAISAGDEVAAKKPAPDVYLAALDKLGIEAANCLALEDSRNGLSSAMAAGVATVISPSRYTAGEDFSGAARVVGEFTELLPLAETAKLLARHNAGRRS
jgi:HAD superfamily hydrolase (TIGR01509 family)